MGKCKIDLNIDVFDELYKKFQKAEVDMKPAIEKAMIEARDNVNHNLRNYMKVHKRTGRTEKSIKDIKPEWDDEKITQYMGFNISDGGFPSIFLIYGTPRQKPDTKLKSLLPIGNNKTSKDIQKKILERINKYLEKSL